MHLIVGLGNPGGRFENNRHNIGFMAVDAIHRHEGFSPWKPKYQALVAEGQIDGEKALLVKPTTFMNESGRAVGEALRFFKLSPSHISVLHDELDLAPGKVRVKVGGGHGGHNGLKSLDAHIGKEYRRLRLGIGHPGHKDAVHGHVLGDFAKADRDWLDPLLDEIARNAGLLVKGDDALFMNRIANATGSTEPLGAKGSGQKAKKGQSHIRQARQGYKPKAPQKGPMADMLRKLFGEKNT